MSPSFNESPIPPEMSPDAKLEDYYHYLKSIRQGEGLGSVTRSDVDTLYGFMQNPHYFKIENVENLFSLLEQIAASEGFENQELANEVIRQVGYYRQELGL